MSKEHYINLQPSEAAIAGMAATIFAAWVRNREVNDDNEEALVRKAVELAVRLADHTDRIVKSDSEWLPEESKSSVVL